MISRVQGKYERLHGLGPCVSSDEGDSGGAMMAISRLQTSISQAGRLMVMACNTTIREQRSRGDAGQ